MNEKAGLYIHIPFCKNKCPYCDFCSFKYDENAAEKYVNRLVQEIKKYRGVSFDSIYFGGGTPSILNEKLFTDIFFAIMENFKIDEDSEITVECNPSSLTNDLLKAYKKLGVNRISIGMQSAVKEERLALGRTSGKEQVMNLISYSSKIGIDNINLDFMLGIPKQTIDSLDETLNFIEESGVKHISAYMLKIEENTVFYKMKDKLNIPDDDLVADMYLKTVEKLENIGLKQYEISNFAYKGYESKHNIKYWTLAPYLGIGISAHSYWNKRRFYYNSDFEVIDYGEGGDKNEHIMLGLRLKKGIKKDLISKDISDYVKNGFIEEKNGLISFTPKGFLVSNSILSDLIE